LILHNGRSLQITQWDLVVESDASTQGWGASCKGTSTGGAWTRVERAHHINFLELLAAFLALKTFATGLQGKAILIRIDNVTALAHLNKMGGSHSSLLSNLAIEIWKWCVQRSIVIHAEHLPGRENVRADWESRHLKDSSDWRLHRGTFQLLEERLGPFSIDLFASRTNTQLPVYCSWKPDPMALTVDALSILWNSHHPYLFPPFTLINRCLEKISKEEIEA